MYGNKSFKLGYRWLIEGQIETVYHFVSDASTYPRWWPQFLWAETSSPEVRVGNKLRASVKSGLPYQLSWDCEVARLEPPYLVEVASHVSLGDRFRLVGPVRFVLSQQLGLVEVLNEQEMTSELALPPGLHQLAQKVFSWNHDFAMRLGGEGLQQIVWEAERARVDAIR